MMQIIEFPIKCSCFYLAFCRPCLAHKFHPVPYYSDDSAGLHTLPTTTSHSVLDLGQTIEPGDHHLWPDLHLADLFRQSRNDVGQSETSCDFEGVDRRQTRRNISGRQQGVQYILNSIWWRGCDAVVNGLDGDGLPDNVFLGNFRRISYL